jgi:hypothetical protein
MQTLRQSGWLKVLQGVTTPDEILRVTQADDLAAPALAGDPEPVPVLVAAPADKPIGALSITFSPPRPGENPADRRIYERIEEKIYVRFKLFKTKAGGAVDGPVYEPELVGITKNISAGGLLFNASEYFAPGKIIDVTITLSDEEKNIECLARVVRCQEIVANKDFQIAVCFLDLPNSERSRLNRYIERTTA